MIMCEIIGRKKEIAELKRYYESGRAEFVAVYGRRRVGKTFLIDEVFHDDMVFHHTGLSPYDRRRKVTLKDQLQNFYFSLLRHGMEDIAQPKLWMEAFFLLERFWKLAITVPDRWYLSMSCPGWIRLVPVFLRH